MTTVRLKKASQITVKKNKNQINSFVPDKRKAFLDYLIELSTGDNKLTFDELKDEVNTFMIAVITVKNKSGFSKQFVSGLRHHSHFHGIRVRHVGNAPRGSSPC